MSDVRWDGSKPPLIFKNEAPGRVKMQVQPLDFFNDFILIDDTYDTLMKMKFDLLQNSQDVVIASGLGKESTEKAKRETLNILMAYLPERFPELFKKVDQGLLVTTTGEIISGKEGEDPLITCSKLVTEDFCILEYSPEIDQYVLTCGVVCFPMRWSLQAKMNNPMSVIHGPVTAYTKHLQTLVSDVFKSMRPGKGVKRGNWAVFNDLKGPLDLYTPEGHVERASANRTTVYGPNTGTELLLREEYQTLYKLPETQAILFTIRTYQRHLSDLHNSPKEDVRLLVQALETLNPDMAVYKGAEFWREAALKYLHQDILKEMAKL